ncbi:FAR1-related sequence 5-like protein, partial [Tanacetum coccineum]
VGSYQPTPEGSKFWIPDAKNKPVEGKVFDTLELALKFYKDYAREAGFEVVNKVINRRKRASHRCGCDAKLRIRRTYDNKWRVYMFLEKHNHRLVHKEDYIYLKVARKLSFPQQQLLNHLSTVNERDDKVSKRLVRLFWADEKSKQYFDVFGDVVPFDATFRSNRYNMILVLFTGIDNHNRCILFGAALLDSEHIKKYRWLLKRFKKIFGKAPKVVVTDQDSAMKVVIEEIFPDSRHQLCMWHIMKKLAGKAQKTIITGLGRDSVTSLGQGDS